MSADLPDVQPGTTELLDQLSGVYSIAGFIAREVHGEGAEPNEFHVGQARALVARLGADGFKVVRSEVVEAAYSSLVQHGREEPHILDAVTSLPAPASSPLEGEEQ